jgi:hypothetical protein
MPTCCQQKSRPNEPAFVVLSCFNNKVLQNKIQPMPHLMCTGAAFIKWRISIIRFANITMT